MKALMHFVEKHEDIAEALGGVTIMLLTGGAILGIAPSIIIMTSQNF